ncbi:MAG: precorrin-6A/cobalt-precorrin-6A reductase [Hyphomicrobiales bacterium]|nr:precorrin-6A/cobalt-precorrin-6A reductase [Hyphomicrobiales bacterium]
MHKILIIGGTAEGFKIASLIEKKSFLPILSLQGNTLKPKEVYYETRVGGFGGVEGLKDYLIKNSIKIIIDASHPYSIQISNNALIASKQLDIKLIKLNRSAWKQTYSDNWLRVKSFSDSKYILDALPRESRIFLTIGKKYLPIFYDCKQWIMIRTIDQYNNCRTGNRKYITGRGPFQVSQELILLKGNNITHIVSRNSGSKETYAKIQAAKILGIEIIMIDREKESILGKNIHIDEIIKNTVNYLGRNK